MYLLCLALVVTSVILTECAPSTIDFNHPVTSLVYQGAVGQGFATNYFKAKKGPAIKYREQNIQDIHAKGFRNVRLRSRADLYDPPYTSDEFTNFLTKLEEVVDKCISVGVAPIVSWIHHVDEADATEEARQNYVTWWTKVANRLKDKNYLLSFNLFTELGVDYCTAELPNCDNSLRQNITKYNQWTSNVVAAIRNSGGNNANRILILASPTKTSRGLSGINATIYNNDNYMMIEWHDYAAGPNKKLGSRRYWSGNGTTEQRSTLIDGLEEAGGFGLPSYFGAWMPRDNKDGDLVEEEVINFARFFVSELKQRGIPWSLNVLDDYYDTKASQWIPGIQTFKGTALNTTRVLENIRTVM